MNVPFVFLILINFTNCLTVVIVSAKIVAYLILTLKLTTFQQLNAYKKAAILLWMRKNKFIRKCQTILNTKFKSMISLCLSKRILNLSNVLTKIVLDILQKLILDKSNAINVSKFIAINALRRNIQDNASLKMML